MQNQMNIGGKHRKTVRLGDGGEHIALQLPHKAKVDCKMPLQS